MTGIDYEAGAADAAPRRAATSPKRMLWRLRFVYWVSQMLAKETGAHSSRHGCASSIS